MSPGSEVGGEILRESVCFQLLSLRQLSKRCGEDAEKHRAKTSHPVPVSARDQNFTRAPTVYISNVVLVRAPPSSVWSPASQRL